MIAGCHTPVIGSGHVADAIAATRLAPTATVPAQPDESLLAVIQAALGAEMAPA